MFIVGLTGGIASGKSTVAKMIEEMGIPVVDADLIARQVVEPGLPAYMKLKKAFGDEIILENGDLDRGKLGKIIFMNQDKRKLVNSITHPYIYASMRWQIIAYFLQGCQFIVLDLPLLFETRSHMNYLDKIITVCCEDDVQLERLRARNPELTQSELKERITAQMHMDDKAALSHYVIENSGPRSQARSQLEQIVKVLKASKTHIWNRFIYGGLALLLLALFIFVFKLIFTKLFL